MLTMLRRQAVKSSADQLQAIVRAVSHPSTRIWENCCDLLAAASERWQAAAEAILEMLHKRRAHVRFNAICSLSEKTPAAVIEKALKAGLGGRNSHSRWKAADTASSLNQRQLIPDVAAGLRHVSPMRTLKTQSNLLCTSCRMVFLSVARTTAHITFQSVFTTPRAAPSTEISEREFAEKGIETIVAEVRRSHRRASQRDNQATMKPSSTQV